jgi:pSer/pThr/pTyr-binding forkhead associated (FHA) protein
MGRVYILNGPDVGRSFQLKKGVNTVGRSLENDVALQDKTVSRQHLKIVKKADRWFITDLKSENHTFVGGNYLTPGTEIGVKEGVPIVIGMTVIAIGETSLSLTRPFLDSIGLTRETGDESGIFAIHKDKTNQKKLEVIYKVSNILDQKLGLKETLDKVLEVVGELLVEIDTASFILIHPRTTKVTLFAHRSRKSEVRPAPKFSPQVVHRVIKGKKAVMISDSDTEIVDSELATTLKTNGISSVMCVPVISGSQVVGVIYLHSLKKPYGFRQEDVSLFEDIAQRTGVFIQYGQYFSELSKIMEELNPEN